ncbi:alkaline phosphatase [Pseudozyma hubeiensis SY62]|uniref:Alkaline phosphatase n=1 Tax=Pseudozyma hubeiensis (strain SY62) TaxID=1305764 RepID=R9P8A5_PSEHS|nr:alkaline phosphatase [Pseudozyma hubeiensis SY62]GAC97574.1 alkaline phosphatase [Pseudozyma hubeiensis SY62]
MSLQNDLPRGFVKQVVRRATVVARAAATSSASTTAGAHQSNVIARTQTSSLQAPVVAIMLGGFIGVFLLFVLVGITCKYANRPRSDARPQAHAKAMFQPSAAGYGSTAGYSTAAPSMHDVSNPNVGLLDSVQPMGRGGRYEEADDSLGSSNGMLGGNGAHGQNGGFGMIPSNSAGSFNGDDSRRFAPSRANGHARGASSGIELPGPAASAAFRRNVSGSHPPVQPHPDESYDSPQSGHALASGSIMPDGSGFTPGQIFDHNAINGGAPKVSPEMHEHRSSYLGAPPGVLPRRNSSARDQPQQRAYLRGPPPSSSKNRRSRYHQNQASTDSSAMRRSRIDSVGPGTYRKSMFLQEGEASTDFTGGSQMRRTTSNNNNGGGAPKPLRRVESIGKGDARRASRYTPSNGASRNPATVMPEGVQMPSGPAGYRDGMPASNVDAYLNAGGQGGWGDGRRSPYGGSSNGSTSPLGPLGPNDPMLTMQQQQQQGAARALYGAGLGAPSPGSYAPSAPLGAGLGRGMEASSYAASRQVY